jgi:hypothetical protein
MVSHVVVAVEVIVLVVPSLTVVEMKVDVLQISASCVSQLVGWEVGKVGFPSLPMLYVTVTHGPLAGK